MKKEKVERVLKTFDEMFPDARCELNHSNPLELLIATMLSAQTTDASVNKVTPALFERYHTAYDYAHANQQELESYIRKIGLYRNKAKNIILMCKALEARFDGEVPADFDELFSLPGVGRKTANVEMAEAFHVPALAVDTHCARIARRLGFAFKKDDVDTIERKLKKQIPQDRWIKTHHQMIFFGRYHCKAQSPHCYECPLVDICKETNKKLKDA